MDPNPCMTLHTVAFARLADLETLCAGFPAAFSAEQDGPGSLKGLRVWGLGFRAQVHPKNGRGIHGAYLNCLIPHEEPASEPSCTFTCMLRV